jgi:hypothetical protein
MKNFSLLMAATGRRTAVNYMWGRESSVKVIDMTKKQHCNGT